MMLQNPVCLLSGHLDRVLEAVLLLGLSRKVRELSLSHMIAGVSLPQEMAAGSHRLDHIQRQRLTAGVQASSIDTYPVVNVRIEHQLLRVQEGTALKQTHATAGLGSAQRT